MMYVSVRDAVLREAGYGSIAEGLSDLKLDSVELEFYRDYSVFPADSWERADVHAREAARAIESSLSAGGSRICAFLLHNNFNCDDQKGEINWVIDVIRTAELLNVPAVRIDAITEGEREEPFDVRISRFVDCMREVLAATESSAVVLGIENHGVQGNDPDFLHGVIRRVGNERLGVTMDTGNFYWNGFPLERVYEILESVGPKTKHTHVKNICYPEEKRSIQRESGWEYSTYVSPIYEGDIDHGRVVDILKKCGYRGPLTIEDESLGKFDEAGKKAVLKKDVEYLKGLLATS
jgi:sugar phosphate isomerase/epimerase